MTGFLHILKKKIFLPKYLRDSDEGITGDLEPQINTFAKWGIVGSLCLT